MERRSCDFLIALVRISGFLATLCSDVSLRLSWIHNLLESILPFCEGVPCGALIGTS